MKLLQKLFSIFRRKKQEEYPLYFDINSGIVYLVYNVITQLKKSETPKNFIITNPYDKSITAQSEIFKTVGINRSYNINNIKRVLNGFEKLKILQNMGNGYYTLRKIKFTPEADKKLVFHANILTIKNHVKHSKLRRAN